MYPSGHLLSGSGAISVLVAWKERLHPPCPSTSPPPKSARGGTWRRPAEATLGKRRLHGAGRPRGESERSCELSSSLTSCSRSALSVPAIVSVWASGQQGSASAFHRCSLCALSLKLQRAAGARLCLQGQRTEDGGTPPEDVLGWLHLKIQGAAPKMAPALPPARPLIKRGAFSFSRIGKQLLLFASEFVPRIQLFLLISLQPL